MKTFFFFCSSLQVWMEFFVKLKPPLKISRSTTVYTLVFYWMPWADTTSWKAGNSCTPRVWKLPSIGHLWQKFSYSMQCYYNFVFVVGTAFINLFGDSDITFIVSEGGGLISCNIYASSYSGSLSKTSSYVDTSRSAIIHCMFISWVVSCQTTVCTTVLKSMTGSMMLFL